LLESLISTICVIGKRGFGPEDERTQKTNHWIIYFQRLGREGKEFRGVGGKGPLTGRGGGELRTGKIRGKRPSEKGTKGKKKGGKSRNQERQRKEHCG